MYTLVKSIEETARCKKILSKMDIYSIGRYGSWSHCSIEDNIMEAENVSCIILIPKDVIIRESIFWDVDLM